MYKPANKNRKLPGSHKSKETLILRTITTKTEVNFIMKKG